MTENRPVDLGYESTYGELRPEPERRMSARLARALEERRIEPGSARGLGVPDANEMVNTLLWATDLELIEPDWASELGIAAPAAVASPPAPAPSWTEVSASEHEWERAALAHLRRGLDERLGLAHHAWANLEFVAGGSVYEVDVLLVVPCGVFLIEIKSWPGRLEGDAGTWTLTRPSGRTDAFANHLLLADRKAKRLKSLLRRSPAYADVDPPYITPLVFLSHPELDCRLDELGRQAVHGLDGHSPLPGILHRLTSPDSTRIDDPALERLGRALDQIGIRPAPRATSPPAAATRPNIAPPASSRPPTPAPSIRRSAPTDAPEPLPWRPPVMSIPVSPAVWAVTVLLGAAVCAYLALAGPVPALLGPDGGEFWSRLLLGAFLAVWVFNVADRLVARHKVLLALWLWFGLWGSAVAAWGGPLQVIRPIFLALCALGALAGALVLRRATWASEGHHRLTSPT